jgi:hypothetical protein
VYRTGEVASLGWYNLDITQTAHGEEGLSLPKPRLEPPTACREEPSTSSVSPQDKRKIIRPALQILGFTFPFAFFAGARWPAANPTDAHFCIASASS